MKTQYKIWLKDYSQDNALALSPTTLRSVHYTLQKLESILTGSPETLWKALEKHKPYTRVTIWSRVIKYWDWLIQKGYVTGENEYRYFRTHNKRLFKNTYNRRFVICSLAEIGAKISSIPDPAIRSRAIYILKSGLRYHESESITDGQISGKGGRLRPLYNGQSGLGSRTEADRGTIRSSIPYLRFYRALRKVGLKPHDLRKACATALAQKLNLFDLCEVMGWQSVNTARNYVAPMERERLDKKVKEILEQAQ